MTAGKPCSVLPAASRDSDAATDYYFGEGGEALASRWVQALQTALDQVAARPATGSTRYAAMLGLKGQRFLPVSRFPYLVFYIETSQAVSVIRVLHGSRDIPETLRDE